MTHGMVDAYMQFNFEVCGKEKVRLAYSSAALTSNLLTWTGDKNIIKIYVGDYMNLF